MCSGILTDFRIVEFWIGSKLPKCLALRPPADLLVALGKLRKSAFQALETITIAMNQVLKSACILYSPLSTTIKSKLTVSSRHEMIEQMESTLRPTRHHAEGESNGKIESQ